MRAVLALGRIEYLRQRMKKQLLTFSSSTAFIRMTWRRVNATLLTAEAVSNLRQLPACVVYKN